MKGKQGEIEVYASVVKMQEHSSQLVIHPLDLQEAELRDKTGALSQVCLP